MSVEDPASILSENFEIKDSQQLKEFIKNSESAREQTYKELTDLLDSGTRNFDYIRMMSILDWLNTQVILGVMKKSGKWNCLRAVDILSASTKKLIEAMFKEG